VAEALRLGDTPTAAIADAHFKPLGRVIPDTSVIDVYLRYERIGEVDRRENYRLGPGIEILQTDSLRGSMY
jgi:hypothetical protein